MMRHDLRQGLPFLGRPTLECMRDCGMDLLAPTFEHRLMGCILQQRVLKGVDGLGWCSSTRNELSGDELMQCSDQLVCRASLPDIAIHDRLQIADFGINIPALLFPAPGRYEFRLRMNGRVIAQKDFHVIQLPAPSEA